MADRGADPLCLLPADFVRDLDELESGRMSPDLAFDGSTCGDTIAIPTKPAHQPIPQQHLT